MAVPVSRCLPFPDGQWYEPCDVGARRGESGGWELSRSMWSALVICGCCCCQAVNGDGLME